MAERYEAIHRFNQGVKKLVVGLEDLKNTAELLDEESLQGLDQCIHEICEQQAKLNRAFNPLGTVKKYQARRSGHRENPRQEQEEPEGNGRNSALYRGRVN